MQPPGSAPHRLLVVEDDSDLLELLKEFFESHQFSVTTARDGSEGMEALKKGGFDAVICDMMLPSMSGEAFFTNAKESHPELAHRFVFLTGHSDNPRVNEFIRSAGTPVLYKPVGISQLLKALASVLPA